MSRSLPRTAVRRALTVAVTTAAVSAAVAMPSPALAGSMFFSKTSGRTATVQWLEVGSLAPAPVPGNIHFGDLFVEDVGGGRAFVFGQVIDLTCPPGVVPERPGGGHGDPEEEPGAPGCVFEGARFIEGGALTFTLDRKLTRARLTGTLSVHGETGPAASAPVDTTWTGVGSTFSEVNSGRVEEDGATYSYRYRFTGRDAVVSGRMGPMNFTDDPDDVSSGQIGSYRNASRERIG